MRICVGAAVAGLALAAAGPAVAVETYDFEITGETLLRYSDVDVDCYIGECDANVEPTPLGGLEAFALSFRAQFTDDGEFIELISPVDFSGLNYDAPVISAHFEFMGRRVIGGWALTDTINDTCGGGVLISLSYADFSFVRDTCQFGDDYIAFVTDIGSTPYPHNPQYRLTQTRNGVAIPEPGAWALMIAGFGAAGAALRRRRPAAVSPTAEGR